MRTRSVVLPLVLVPAPRNFHCLLPLSHADDLLRGHVQLLDAIEDDVLKGGYIIDWHACDLFPKSWIDLVVVLRCPSTAVFYDRLTARYD